MMALMQIVLWRSGRNTTSENDEQSDDKECTLLERWALCWVWLLTEVEWPCCQIDSWPPEAPVWSSVYPPGYCCQAGLGHRGVFWQCAWSYHHVLTVWRYLSQGRYRSVGKAGGPLIRGSGALPLVKMNPKLLLMLCPQCGTGFWTNLI